MEKPKKLMKILIQFAHPALEKSRINHQLIDAVKGLEGVTVNDLYEQYPEYDIDINKEQNLLVEHDVIIFHHPFFWYSTPAILKEWQDLVLEHGWAYGSDGNALQGKKMFNVISTGGKEAAYQKNGYNRFTIRELLAPLEQTAYLCGMKYLPPFIVYGAHRMQPAEIKTHAESYKFLLKAIANNRFDFSKTVKLHNLNQEKLPILK